MDGVAWIRAILFLPSSLEPQQFPSPTFPTPSEISVLHLSTPPTEDQKIYIYFVVSFFRDIDWENNKGW